QLEVADRLASLGTMAAGVAHQINNPLAVVIANAEYLRGELDEIAEVLRTSEREAGRELAERVRELAHVESEIASAGSRIAKIVADLKTFAGPTHRASGEADIARAIGWAMRTTAHEFRHRARLTHYLPVLPLVLADELRLGQVFVNLLMNAAQAI